MWSFIQNQLLGMAWLRDLVNRAFEALGADTSQGFASSASFFVYDTLKIFILLCVLIFVISFIQSWFPPEKTRKLLKGKDGLAARVIAALLGTLTPFCSCSSIPIFMGFAAAGLPMGVIFSFLISSPMVDLASLMLLTGIFGAKIAVLYVLFGLIIAVAGGSVIASLDMEDQLADFLRTGQAAEIDPLKMSITDRLSYAANQVRSNLKRVWPYILAGVAAGSLIHNRVPEELVIRLLGSGSHFGVIIAVLCGAPVYADIFGTVPIAEALLYKGAGLGVVLSFMMSVTTLSLPSLVMLKRAVKNRLLAVFIAVCLVGIIAAGYIFNVLGAYI